ncbi:MAG: ornithine cyclodeaminase [Comamonadaceae bacterium]|nr:MAG: ornithine cyclodeaminase [Comamonadaceae bacterium]
MVDYIGISDIQRIIRQRGAAAFIEGLAAEIELDYRRWGEFDKSARHAIHSPGGVIELMPTSDGRQYSFKYVNGHPKNTDLGLLTVTAFGVLADVDTGYPLLLSELTVTTALRTAAMSALAAQKLARPGSRVMAIIGNGAQSEFQAIGFHQMLGIREVKLFDIDRAASDKLARNLRQLGLADLVVTVCKSAAEAVQGADIVTTITADKRNAVILTPEMIRPGMHLNAVGGDCPGKTELHADILLRPDARVVVEYEPQSRIEGEIQQLPADFAVAEFADVLAGTATGRTSDDEVTIFDSVGFALEDYSALRYLHKLQLADVAGRRQIDLIPHLDDPKNLFGLLQADKPQQPAGRDRQTESVISIN